MTFLPHPRTEIAIARFLLLAVLLACVSAFVPPATLAQPRSSAAPRSRWAPAGASRLLKKPKAAEEVLPK